LLVSINGFVDVMDAVYVCL